MTRITNYTDTKRQAPTHTYIKVEMIRTIVTIIMLLPSLPVVYRPTLLVPGSLLSIEIEDAFRDGRS